MQEGVKKIRSESVYSIYSHINPSGNTDHNKLQYSCNCEPKYEYVIPIVSVDRILHNKSLWGPNPFQELAKLGGK